MTIRFLSLKTGVRISVIAFLSSVSLAALADPKADIPVTTNLNEIQVQFSGGGAGTGCNSNSCQKWDTQQGRCSKPRLLSRSSNSQSITCRNGDGATRSGSITRTTEVYGWTLPPNGSQSNSYTYTYYSGTSCPSGYGISSLPSNSNSPNPSAACKVSSNKPSPPTITIPPPTPKPDPPPSGGGGGSSGGGSGSGGGYQPSTITITNDLICSSSHSKYSMGSAPNDIKNKIINAYRNLNSLGRCPEEFSASKGWTYWQNHYMTTAGKVWNETLLTIQNSNTAATRADSVRFSNEMCHTAAVKLLGSGKFKTATFTKGSGNGCTIKY